MIDANATLTRVAERGTGEAYDGPLAPGPDVWAAAGGAPAYVGEQPAQETGTAGDVERVPTMIVQNDEAPVPWSVGQLVFYTRDGEAARVATVQSFRQVRSRNPSISPRVLTTRVVLADIAIDAG